MRIKMYFVTYRECKTLNETLKSFFDTCNYEDFCEINIINNHSKFRLEPPTIKYANLFGKINVIHNNLRPDFSSGHLSRNWNQCIINGFKNLNDPDCDILITSQNDVHFYPEWVDKIKNFCKSYDFFQVGHGDCLCSYTVDAIKKVGIWDERYCGIGYQEADYFLRSVFHNPERTSLNDSAHDRIFNQEVDGNDLQGKVRPFNGIKICKKSEGGHNDVHIASRAVGHKPSLTVFKEKFKSDLPPDGNRGTSWNREGIINAEDIYTGLLKTAMLYPYFEKDIPDRESKNYIN
jgi:hypothetical protein